MPRHVKTLKITADGRDKGKTFILTEMAADQGERWANRAILALTNTGASIPQEALEGGFPALFALVGVQAIGLLRHETVQPMLDELWPACVRVEAPTPGLMPQEIMEGPGSQIEEVATRYRIYQAVWELHTGFSLAGVSPTSAQMQGDVNAVEPSWITSISRALLGLLRRFG